MDIINSIKVQGEFPMINILLVEDDNTLAIGLKYALENEGYDVELANTIEAATKALCKTQFHLIILDIMLPDGNGYDFCRYVRKHSDIPIIFLTSYDEEVNIVLGLDIGGDDYIIKPFRVMELMSRIKAVLRRHKLAEQKKPNYWISGNIKINPESGKVTKNNNEIVLTPVEYKLLLTFVKHPHQVLTRGQILEYLWDIDGEFVDDNTLSVYIRRLREKIEDNPSKPSYIKTIRGVGYKWDYDDQ